jgi:drug/metabolite transporter (DMT)-like permease
LVFETKTAAASSAPPVHVRTMPNLPKAIGWTLVSVLAFALTAWSGRECGRHMSAMNMVFYRNIISLLILLATFRWLGISLASLRANKPWMQWGRALVHFCGQWCWMAALLLIPLIELISLEFTLPLWVALLAPAILGEKLTMPRIMAAVIGFTGVLVIVLGPVVVSGGSAAPSFNLGTALALICAVFFCFNLIGTRYLTRHDGPLTILMFMVVNNSILAFVLGLPTMSVPPAGVVPWILMLGVCSLVAHFALARALAYGEAVVVAPMDFLRIPLMVALGALVYHEPLHGIVLVGTALVLTGNIVNIWYEQRRWTAA